MELDTDYAAEAIELNRSERVNALWQDFLELNAGLESEFFPAYLMIKQPAIIHSIEDVKNFRNKTTLAVIDLLLCRIHGKCEIESRGFLQKASPDILRVYLGSVK